MQPTLDVYIQTFGSAGALTIGATGAAHFGTVQHQLRKCLIQEAKWNTTSDLIVVHPQLLQSRPL
jgi:hypothetical protein